MQAMYDVSAFLGRFGYNPELTSALIKLLDVWQDVDEHAFRDQDLQRKANSLAGDICSNFGLTKVDIQIINDHEAAFRSYLHHPSRLRNQKVQP